MRKFGRGYLRYKTRKLRAKWARFRDRALATHPAFTHVLIDAPTPAVEILGEHTAPDAALIARTAACYRKAAAGFGGSGASMWGEIAARHRDFMAALEAGEVGRVAPFLDTMFRSDLLEGMAHAEAIFLDPRRNPYTGNYFRLRTSDALLSLAEALALHPVPSFAQMRLPDYIDHLRADQDALFARVEAALGFSLAAPALGQPPVCRFSGTATTPDLLRHAYTVHRMRALGFGPESRVLEIGGGFGAVALLAYRAGYRRYTIVDLPYVNAIQMLYLGHALGAAAVSGYGETAAAIELLPPQAIGDIPDRGVDLVVNADSLPEMDRATALDYLRQVRRIARGFLSINQEAQKPHPGMGAQHFVPGLVAEAGGFERRHRFRHWMEQGYVEEFYAVNAG